MDLSTTVGTISALKLTDSDVIALASATVALCSLFIAVWQGYISRRHHVLSVKPHVDIVLDFSAGDQLCIHLKNGGLGPAVVESVYFAEADGSKVNLVHPGDYHRLSATFLKTPELFGGIEYLVLGRTSVVVQGERLTLFQLRSKNDSRAFKKLVTEAMPSLRMTVTYRCMYGKRYKSSFSSWTRS